MLLPSGNPFKCHEEVLSLQPMISPKHFDIVFPLTEGSSEGPDAFRFFFKQQSMHVCMYGHHLKQEKDQPGKVASPARGQLNKENEYSPVPVRA